MIINGNCISSCRSDIEVEKADHFLRVCLSSSLEYAAFIPTLKSEEGIKYSTGKNIFYAAQKRLNQDLHFRPKYTKIFANDVYI